MFYPGTLGQYLLINCPDATEAHSVHVKYVDGVEQCQLVGWLPNYGNPPSPEQVAAWEPPPLLKPIPKKTKISMIKERLASAEATAKKSSSTLMRDSLLDVISSVLELVVVAEDK